MTKGTSIIFSVCAFLVLSTMVVLAKRETIGIYAIVDKVEFEPNEESSERIRIWGVFVVPVPHSSGQYKRPRRGYLYFKTERGVDRVARPEWSNLKSVAGTGQAIGFAQYWVANPADPSGNPHHSLEVKVHRDGDAALPAEYPTPHARGIVTTGDKQDPDFDKIVAKLIRASRH